MQFDAPQPPPFYDVFVSYDLIWDTLKTPVNMSKSLWTPFMNEMIYSHNQGRLTERQLVLINKLSHKIERLR